MAALNIEAMLAQRADDGERRGFLTEGEIVGEWKVVAFVGSGRSAEVYRVINTRLGGEAALKLLVDASGSLVERFLREIDLVRTLPIAALPRYFDEGSVRGKRYYVMEYLQPLILPLKRAVLHPFMSLLAKAVGEIHAAGYVHRDLKPGNVLLRRDSSPVVIDLGLAKKLGGFVAGAGEDGLSVVDGRAVGVGTVDFAAPEQLLRGEASVRSDIFALGRILKVAAGDKPGWRLAGVIRKATATDPADRYESAIAFRRAFEGATNLPLRRMTILLVAAAAGVIAFFAMRPLSPLPASAKNVVLTHEKDFSTRRRPGESAGDYLHRLALGANQGDAACQAALAEAYFHGCGTDTNFVAAVRWYEAAANQGHPGAEASIGLCKLRGIGCERNPDEAVAWFLRAANHGHLGAMNDLAFCFINGYGVDYDPAEGFAWAMKAAERGHPAAQAMVGECYLDGLGVARNPLRADDWLQRAARQGNERAMMLLRTR